MTTSQRSGEERPTIFFLHYLGGSSREWARVVERLEQHFECVAIDLPGFGDAVQTPGYAVAEMAESVARTVRARASRRWLLAGHSMGAKVTAVLARSAEDGARGLGGLEGLILLAGSPPSPEPMAEDQRRKMLGWFAGDSEANRADAQTYIESNSNEDLDAAARELCITDVLRANRAAWVAWLERGSREDWSDRIGILRTPALVIAGSDDENLGPSAQRALMVPHFANARLESLPGAKHLLPLERAPEVARLIDERFAGVRRSDDSSSTEAYRDLIASTRVSSGTRQALSARAEPDDPAYEPRAMSRDALRTLRAVVDRVVPQTGSTRIDLAARIDTQLHAGDGDGWRFAMLPPDAEAYRAGLFTLDATALRSHALAFAHLDGAMQDALLERAAAGKLEPAQSDSSPPRIGLSASQMRAWFEDLRGDAVKLYVAHPATLARMGYSGIANGGDGEPKSGFILVGPGEREAWEPLASPDSRA